MKALLLVAAAAMVVGIYAFIAIPNYQECRAHEYSRLYCAATHLVR